MGGGEGVIRASIRLKKLGGGKGVIGLGVACNWGGV